MTDPVMEAKARTKAALARWHEARRAVNDPAIVPERLDALVSVAERTVAVIGQDVVTEVEAIVVELSALRFPVEPEESLGTLESATLSLDGALGRLSRAASRAGFAQAEDDLGLPPGVRVPAKEIAKELEAFVAAVEGVRPVLERLATAQAMGPGVDAGQGMRPDDIAKQEALIRNVIEKATVKIEIIGIKTGKISLIDVSGLAALARELGRVLQSFVATVDDAASRLSAWLSQEVRGWIKPVLRPLERGASQLAKGAAAWIRRREGDTKQSSEPPIESPEPATPGFDWLEAERMILRGEIPPVEVIPFVTSFDAGRRLDRRSLAALGHMTALRKLVARVGQGEDLSPLAGLTALQSLRLDGTQVSDLSPLAGLTALQSLSLDGTQVSDLSPLAGLTALQSLNLYRTGVRDLSPLAGLTALQYLNLYGTQVSDLSPLRNLPQLTHIATFEEKRSLIETLGRPARWTGNSYVVERG